jgi:hypothetical protein
MIRTTLIALLLAGCAAPQKQDAAAPKPVKDVSPLEKQFADKPDDPKVKLELAERYRDGVYWVRD